MKRGDILYEKWYVDAKNIKNVERNGEITGFTVGVKPPYYRGVSLNLINTIGIRLDGEKIPTDEITFTVEAGCFTWQEMADQANARWEFGERAEIFVPLPGGISRGTHVIEVEICILIVYWGGASYVNYPFTFEMA